MAELARYDLPLVAKYALNPASAGALGQMWFRFLEQYATRSTPNQPRMSTCWTCSLPCCVHTGLRATWTLAPAGDSTRRCPETNIL